MRRPWPTLICLGLMLLLSLSSAMAEEQVTLTLDEAARVALAKNPRIREVLARVGVAQAETEMAASPARTQATLLGDVTQIRQPPGAPTQAVIGGNVAQFQAGVSDPILRTAAVLRIRQLITDGGRVAAQIRSRKAMFQGARHEARAAWHQLYLDLAWAYLDALQAQREVKIAKSSVRIASRALEIAKIRFKSGDAPKGDVITAELPVAQAELELTQSESKLLSAQEKLNQIMGLPQDTPLRLVEPEPSPLASEDLGSAIKTGLERKPELLALEENLKAAGHSIRAAEKHNAPSLYVGGDVLPTSFPGTGLQAGYQVGFEFQWNFFDGNYSTYLTEKAKGQEKEAQAKLEQERATAERQIREGFRLLDLAEKTIKAGEFQVRSSRESLRIARAKYKAGLGPVFDLSLAQRELKRSQLAHAQGRYDRLRALARIRWSLGMDPLELDVLENEENPVGE